MQNSLRSFENWQASLRCFDWIPKGVPGAQDIDILIERKGRFLVIEGKPKAGPSVLIPLGQFIALRSLASIEQFTVLIVAEDDEAKQDQAIPHYGVLHLTGDTRPHFETTRSGQRQVGFYVDGSFKHMTLDQLQEVLRVWWKTGATELVPQ